MERGDDAEVAATAADRPEQVGVLVLRRDHLLAGRGDDLGLDQVVADETERPLQPAAAAAERQAADAGSRDATSGDRQPVLLGRGVELAPREPAFGAHGLRRGIDRDAGHPAQVHADSCVAHRGARHTVAAAVDRKREIVIACDPNRGRDVVGIGAAGDEHRSAIDHAVEHGSSLVVGAGPGVDELTLEAGQIEAALRHARVSHGSSREAVYPIFELNLSADQCLCGIHPMWMIPHGPRSGSIEGREPGEGDAQTLRRRARRGHLAPGVRGPTVRHWSQLRPGRRHRDLGLARAPQARQPAGLRARIHLVGARRDRMVDRRAVHDRIAVLRRRRDARVRRRGRGQRRQRHVLRRVPCSSPLPARSSTSRSSTRIQSPGSSNRASASGCSAGSRIASTGGRSAVQLAGTLFFNVSTLARAARRPRRDERGPACVAAGCVRLDLLPRRERARVGRGRPPVALVATREPVVVDRAPEPRGIDRVRGFGGRGYGGAGDAASHATTELVNLGTFVGAIGFLIGAFLLLPERTRSEDLVLAPTS